MKQQKLRQKLRKTILFLSFILFPVTINWFSPYLIVDGAISGIIGGSMLIFAALFLSSLILGRSFCSWVCPAGGAQDCASSSVFSKPGPRGRADWIKYFIWAPWIGMIAFLFIRAGGINGIDPLWKTDYGISVSNAGMLLVIFLPIVLVLVILTLTLGRRGACHTICWMAPFMVIGRKLSGALRIPSLCLVPKASACSGCKLCTKRCPMTLEVEEMVRKEAMEHSECILCGECVDNCPEQAIKLSIKKS